MRNKRGWIRILEATIAVMIVSGVMVMVYSRQPSRAESSEEFVYNLQKQILMDIASRGDLRKAVLEDDNETIELYVSERIPLVYGYYLRICGLGDICKMEDPDVFRETRDKSLFVEEAIISSDLGGGGGEEIYSPKKVVFFLWEN
jgi:hypothetical protein